MSSICSKSRSGIPSATSRRSSARSARATSRSRAGSRARSAPIIVIRTRPRFISASRAAARCARRRNSRHRAGRVRGASAGRAARIHQRTAAHAALPGALRRGHVEPPFRVARQHAVDAKTAGCRIFPQRTRRDEAIRKLESATTTLPSVTRAVQAVRADEQGRMSVRPARPQIPSLFRSSSPGLRRT